MKSNLILCYHSNPLVVPHVPSVICTWAGHEHFGPGNIHFSADSFHKLQESHRTPLSDVIAHGVFLQQLTAGPNLPRTANRSMVIVGNISSNILMFAARAEGIDSMS